MSIEARQQREREERVRVILEAAKGLFARQGFQETSMSDIAKACELGKATLYYYFPTKEELYHEIVKACMEHYFKDLNTALEGVTHPADFVEQWVREFVAVAYRDPDFVRLLYPVGKSMPLQDVLPGHVPTRTMAAHGGLRVNLEQALARQGLDVDPSTIFNLVMSYLFGLGHKIAQGISQDNLEGEIRYFLLMVNKTMRMHKGAS
ncbi:TetR/AcrR family transcriptional regulator [Candidatus Neomarinimicrobiota bacterium]